MRLPRPLVCFKLEDSSPAAGQTQTHFAPLRYAQSQKWACASGRHRRKYKSRYWQAEPADWGSGLQRCFSVIFSFIRDKNLLLHHTFSKQLHSRWIKNWNELNVQVERKIYSSGLYQIVSTLRSDYGLLMATLFSFIPSVLFSFQFCTGPGWHSQHHVFAVKDQTTWLSAGRGHRDLVNFDLCCSPNWCSIIYVQ